MTEAPRDPHWRPNAALKRAVVMDDDESVRETTAALLRSFRFEVSLAKTGKEVLDLYYASLGSSEEISLFLLDQLIPHGMGGPETASRLKDLGSSARILLMSGSFAQGQAGHGPTPFPLLAKPFSSDDLAHALTSLFREANAEP